MKHTKRMTPYLIGAAVVAVVMIALGAPRISLLPLMFVIVCPLMMFMMMRGMTNKNSPEDHTGHGCERTIHRDDYILRLRRVDGQVSGLQRMIKSAALQSVAIGLVDEHIRHCVPKQQPR